MACMSAAFFNMASPTHSTHNSRCSGLGVLDYIDKLSIPIYTFGSYASHHITQNFDETPQFSNKSPGEESKVQF